MRQMGKGYETEKNWLRSLFYVTKWTQFSALNSSQEQVVEPLTLKIAQFSSFRLF